MEQSDLLRRVCVSLDGLGIKYLVTGSQATIAYGEPRFTNDIDIVVALDVAHLDAFLATFPEQEFYFSREAALQAIIERNMFNIIHPASGLKVDVIVPKQSSFDRSRFDRARKVQVAPDFTATFASPEDVILKKLEFFNLGGSDKHLRDITGVLKIAGDSLDRDYIVSMATQLGVVDVWQAVEARMEEPRQ